MSIHEYIIKHKRPIMIIFIVAAIISVFLQFGVSVNYKVSDYLPKDAQSTVALSVMDDEFTQEVHNAAVMLNDVSILEAMEYKQRLAAIDGVSNVFWLDDVVDLKTPLKMADQALVENYYKNGKALIHLTIREGDEVAVTDKIYELIGEHNALAGSAADHAMAQRMLTAETTNAAAILVPLVILILLLSTSSWLEPLLFLLTIGISILINMGTNFFFGEISSITSAVSPILQLAVSLDYAIFLLRSFDNYRTQTGDVSKAMRLAMKHAFPAIAASAATTLFGFMALSFMRFQIGAELGTTLARGIIFSFISVMVFLPVLTLSCHKLIDKTKHKKILPEFKNISNLISRVKIPAIILAVVLVVPSFLAQEKTVFTFDSPILDPDNRNLQDTLAINEEFGQSIPIVLLIPNQDRVREYQLSNDLKTINNVNKVVSYAAAVDVAIPPQFLDRSLTSQFYSDNYSRMIIYADTDKEGYEAFAVVRQVQEMARKYYGDAAHSFGPSVVLYDMKNITTSDNRVVDLVATIAILLVLLFTFKSLSLPFLLITTIMAAIWINLAIPYFSGDSINYIGFLIVKTVQLGATIDYAILLSHHYMANRKEMPQKDALKKTLAESFGSILISATILSIAGITLWLTSTNIIVSELGLLLGRGAILSMLAVVCILPALLTIFDKVIAKTTYRTNFYKE